MSVFLEGIDLTGLAREELFGTNVQGATQTANSGALIVYEHEVAFRDFTLAGGEDWGWITYEKLNQVRGLANVIGAEYALEYEGNVFSVRFKSEDIPVIQADPVLRRSNVSPGDYFRNVVIKLMEV
jgi:hypothetical protein